MKLDEPVFRDNDGTWRRPTCRAEYDRIGQDIIDWTPVDYEILHISPPCQSWSIPVRTWWQRLKARFGL